MREDIEQARRAGASDAEILNSLATVQPDLAGEIKAARDAGAPDTEILASIQGVQGQTARQTMRDQSWSDYASDLGKAVVYGAGQEAKAVGTSLAQPSDDRGLATSMEAAGGALRDGGETVARMAGRYQPANFDILHPIDTAGQLPKAAAEAAPGLLATMGAGAAAGAAGGAIAGPIGAAVGGLGGAGLYAFLRYWGGNAQARAAENGRELPAQEDYDNTVGETALQTGVDVATLKAAGFLGRVNGGASGAARALKGPAPVAGSGAQGVVNALKRTAQNSAIVGAGGAVNNAIAQEAATDSIADIDLHEVLNAGATGVGVGGILQGARLPEQVAGAVKYRAPNAATGEALGRIADHMRSDAFLGDPSNPAQTALNLKMISGLADDRLSRIGKTLDEGSRNLAESDPDTSMRLATQRAHLDQYQSFLKQGVVLDDTQIGRIGTMFEPPIAEALIDRSAVNWMASQGKGGKTSSGLIDRPFKLGGVAGIASELLPMAASGGLGGLSMMSLGAHGLGAALGAKGAVAAGGKITGLSDVYRNPLGQIADRYASSPQGRAYPPFTVSDVLNEARARSAAPRGDASGVPPMPPRPPGAIPGAPPSAVPPMPAPPAPAAPAAPTPPSHPALADILGGPAEPRFAPRPDAVEAPTVTQAAPSPASRPAPSPDVLAMAPIDTILAEMRAQAKAENQPLLDVANLHHRSARSIADNPDIPEPIRKAVGEQASAIWREIIAPMEGKSTPDQIKRARSAKRVNDGPAPDDFPRDVQIDLDGGPRQLPLALDTPAQAASTTTISSKGKKTVAKYTPTLVKDLEAAGTEGAVARAAERFLSRFEGADRALVENEIAQTVAAARKIKSTTKVKTTRSGRIKQPRPPRK